MCAVWLYEGCLDLRLPSAGTSYVYAHTSAHYTLTRPALALCLTEVTVTALK